MINKIIFCFFIIGFAYGQYQPIKITDERSANKLSVYALNQSEKDYDVKITITGSNIRQSSARPRFIRVPAASKVLLKTLIVMRGKYPSYTYELEINDSLSRRALRPPSKPIKIKPMKQIVLYIPENCRTCDTILSGLNNGKYLFTAINLQEKSKVKEQIAPYLKHVVIDSLSNPIISLGGVLHTDIEDYPTLMEKLKDQE